MKWIEGKTKPHSKWLVIQQTLSNLVFNGIFMGKSEKCVLCGKLITFRYISMKAWNIDGQLCGDCYNKKLTEYYLGPKDDAITKS